jgi:hypothetical protein
MIPAQPAASVADDPKWGHRPRSDALEHVRASHSYHRPFGTTYVAIHLVTTVVGLTKRPDPTVVTLQSVLMSGLGQPKLYEATPTKVVEGPPVPVGNLRSKILMVQSAQNRHRQRATDGLNSTRDRRVLVQR